MKQIVLLSNICLLLFSPISCDQSPEAQNISNDKKYINPVINRNFADPTPVFAPDGNYYVYATNSTVGEKTINIQVAKSKDLINWSMLGDALPHKPSWADKDFWAPHVYYNEDRQLYYLYYSGESKNGEGKCLGVATSTNPEGPFQDVGAPLLCGKGFINIDPMSFHDPVSGKHYLYWGSGFEPIKVQELSDDLISFKEGSKPIDLIFPITDKDPDNYQRLVEGAWVVYRDGFYYMFYSGDNCCGENAHYAVMVGRSKKPTGPFETKAQVTGKGNSVILERNDRWIAPGHNSIITDENGEDWICYHAIDTEGSPNDRVMLLDKVNYLNGWPEINNGTPTKFPTKAPSTKD